MNSEKIQGKLKGLSGAFFRFPLTIVLLVITAFYIMLSISTEGDYSKLIFALTVGVFISAMAQTLCERFFEGAIKRMILYLISIALTITYYFVIKTTSVSETEVSIKTTVLIFALFFAFMWVPVIKNSSNFNDSFMATFKAVFQALFYGAVLFLGCSIIFFTINSLITEVDYKAYSHTANLIFVLFTPVYFLSLIPLYQNAENEKLQKAIHCPKFLEVLISYIIIPLTGIYTVILIIYIITNISGEFWANNLLEPLIITYSITVISVYVLSSKLNNKFAGFFRLIFPKVLVPLVLLQISASVINTLSKGITHESYYVILFGIFAVCAGIAMSLLHPDKNGIIALLLIVFSIISVTPLVDAFSVSKRSQQSMLYNVLTQNQMLKDNKIQAKADLPQEDKEKIRNSVHYLQSLNYTKNISYLPKEPMNFAKTFGFDEYSWGDSKADMIYLTLSRGAPLNIADFDYMFEGYVSDYNNSKEQAGGFEKNGTNYTLVKEKVGEFYKLVLTDGDTPIINFNTFDIFSRYSEYVGKDQLSLDEATFIEDNDKARIKIIVKNANIEMVDQAKSTFNSDFYIFVEIK